MYLVIFFIFSFLIFMIMLVWSVGIGLINNFLIDIFFNFYYLFVWYCVDIVSSNFVLVIFESEKVNIYFLFYCYFFSIFYILCVI